MATIAAASLFLIQPILTVSALQLPTVVPRNASSHDTSQLLYHPRTSLTRIAPSPDRFIVTPPPFPPRPIFLIPSLRLNSTSSSRLFSSLLGARNDAGSSSSGGGVRQARRRDPKRIGVLVEIETESIVRAKGFPAHTGSFFSMTEGRGPEWIDREHSGTTGGTEALSGERRRQVVPPLPGVAHQRGVIARLRGGGKGMEHARTAARRGNDKKGSSPNGGVVLGGRDKRVRT